ncbi:MAG: hypothetical protein PVF66_12490 [Candidatus Aminicenantes bacterium]
MAKYKERASLGAPRFVGKGGYFEVGESLSVALFEGINSIYQTAVKIDDRDLLAGNFDRIIKFSIQRDKCGLDSPGTKPDIDFKDIPGEGYHARSLRFNIVVLIELLDAEGLEVINSKVVKGDGIYRIERKVTIRADDPYSPTNMGLDQRKNRLEKAIKEAIQDVSNKVIKLLSGGFVKSNN